MQNPNSIIKIIQQDDFYAVFVGNQFFKELMVCNLSDLLFVLDNINTEKEALFIIKELTARLRDYKDEQTKKKFLKELVGTFEMQKDSPGFGLKMSRCVYDFISANKELKSVLNQPVAIALGDVGYPKELLGDTTKLPYYSHVIQEEFEIASIIKHNKVEQIKDSFQKKDEVKPQVETKERALTKIRKFFNKKC